GHEAIVTATKMSLWALTALACGSNPAPPPWFDYQQLERVVGTSFSRLLAQVRQEVLPWALGRADPVAERVARREAEPAALARPEPARLATHAQAIARSARPVTSPSAKQTRFMERLRRDRNLDEAAFAALLREHGASADGRLDRHTASDVIDA